MSLHYQYADMHCDTLLHGLGKGVNDIYDMPDAMLDIKRMAEANVLCQFFAVFFPPRPEMLTPQEREKRLKAGRPEMPPDEELFSKAVSLMKDSFAAHKDVIRQAYCFDDVMKNKEQVHRQPFRSAHEEIRVRRRSRCGDEGLVPANLS